MPSIRLMLWGALGALLLLNYEAWMHDYEPAVPTAAQSSGGTPAGAAAPANSLGQTVPNAATGAPTPAASAAAAPATAPAAAPTASPPPGAIQQSTPFAAAAAPAQS